ncbi:MAG: hypothetical protein PVH88_00445 [Ignavibacteria bacterium]|jgi:hypothetical protein
MLHKRVPEMEIWTGKYDDNKIMQLTKGLVELLSFNGNSLTWYMEDGTSQNWQAVSGAVDDNGNTQPDLQWVKDVGPIPEGQFVINTDIPQLWDNLSAWQKFKSNVGRGQWPGGRISWGDQRYEIFPRSVGNRSGFFLHGGANFGSRGCIDLAGCMSDFFYVFGANKRDTVPLFVNSIAATVRTVAH